MLKPILAVAALLAASPALAAGTATLQSATPNGVQSMTISWQDDDTARIDLPRGGSYTLVRDGEPYTVNRMDGQTMVLSLKGITPHVGLGFGPASDRYQAASVESLRATGATETVAGIAGEEYEMAWTDANGSPHVDRVILSDDPLVIEMTDAFLIFPRALGQPEDPRTVALRERGLGVLRKGDAFHITAISGEVPPADQFTLPAPPMSMDQMMKGMMPGQGQ
ncbi:hypothetical protein [uncultured Rhodospira sp.]|uniref:hypothetical protein n=1 Tax=uncultured Rhodospira sp. TaxID=1936189 RepID=UPI002633BF94|nr:hypothetical protein [uncultured Rhodospira sp.]